jgi:hypothetical protein
VIALILKVLKAEDAQTPSFTHLFLISTEGWDAGTGCATAKPVCQGLFELFAKKQFKPEF